jgi:hypothetical protein
VDKPHFIHRPRLRSKRFREGRSIGRCGDSDGPVAAILAASHAIFTFMHIYAKGIGVVDWRTRSTLGESTPKKAGRTSERAHRAGHALRAFNMGPYKALLRTLFVT